MSNDCPFPAAASFLSWRGRLSEEEAQRSENLRGLLPYPEAGKEAFDRCGSPAERLFLLAGMLGNDSQAAIYFDPTNSSDGIAVGALGGGDPDRTDPLLLVQQFPIGRYRVDFCVPEVQLVIEIDGHEFHERTKEQASHDKGRDRAMVADGYQVLRFTGSEVWNAPSKCAGEIRTIVSAAGTGVR